jgi:hypothetical protein
VISSQWVRGVARQLSPYLMLALVLPGGFLLAALVLAYQRFGPAGDRRSARKSGAAP